MATCSECGVFHPLADGLGQCNDIINGWPIVDGTESQCQEAE
jgi:hypothetical protein